MTRVLLADDQAIVRAGLRTILETDEAIEVVGEASDGREAVTLTQALDPDVVMMDIRMPVLDGIKATERLYIGRYAGQSAHAHHTWARRICLRRPARRSRRLHAQNRTAGTTLRGGACGRAGDALLGSETTRLLIERYLSEPPAGVRPASRLDELTTREQEVLLEMARGRSNEEIGRVLPPRMYGIQLSKPLAPLAVHWAACPVARAPGSALIGQHRVQPA